ncbi:MAG: hypothetical protein JWP37_977 [Mucilaginibacter sp.]|nr:hypothetical protein [Mucilaginibacter sp.]
MILPITGQRTNLAASQSLLNIVGGAPAVQQRGDFNKWYLITGIMDDDPNDKSNFKELRLRLSLFYS